MGWGPEGVDSFVRNVLHRDSSHGRTTAGAVRSVYSSHVFHNIIVP